MSKARLRLRGGKLYDPTNGTSGTVRDVCIEDGRIVASLPDDAPTLDVTGMLVMPGGVDMHAHIAAGSVNQSRRLLPESHHPAGAPQLVRGNWLPRSGSDGIVPTTFTTGYRYAGLGYTTVFDAAVAPSDARHAHAELDDTPIIDAGFYTLLGNDAYLLHLLATGARDRARDYAAWVLNTTCAYAIKVVNPGGVELWKRNVRQVEGLDTPVGSDRVTPRVILETLADAANALSLPHALHIHGNRLGEAGNVETTLASMSALDGRRAHFTHVQFHSYETGWRSGARRVMEYVNAHPEVSIDVGQVMFGPAVTVTADGAVEYLLHKSSGKKWVNIDIELETGCGIVPYEYRDRAAVAALQWVVGLELFLLAADPWRVALSTDHPNGGSFLSYPELIRLLMDKPYRDECLSRVNPKLIAGSALVDGIGREYTLDEIAIITRAAPARLLGLTNKGHLGPGADADITVYAEGENAAVTFTSPRYVFKRGVMVVEEGALRRAPRGRRLYVQPSSDSAFRRHLKQWWSENATMAFENFGAGPLSDAPTEARGAAR
ncbi:MAG TPA: formylmethanofuran dehydrogenase subunit A [Gemmatimonadaceae bacterium]|nr:formylmethanofuran dehydrogenase subunit A [Gemmatimonadaceae bacterium]